MVKYYLDNSSPALSSPNSNVIQSGYGADFKENRDERVGRPLLSRISSNDEVSASSCMRLALKPTFHLSN